MKRLSAVGAAVSLMLGMALAQSNTEQALRDLEQQWTKASLASNADALVPLLADNFVMIESDATMRSKTEVIARTKKAKWEKNEISDLKVHVYGDSAVVTGIWLGKGTDGSGKPYNGRERFADTWVKISGKWQCVASAAAAVK